MSVALDKNHYLEEYESDQHQPWSVQIEPTEGCNRRCSFCGINAIRPGDHGHCSPYRHMNLKLAERMGEELADLCPHARFEFAMHGEPMMHPQIFKLLKVYRHHLPKAQFLLCTNGRTLMVSQERMQEDVERLLEIVDILMIDTYYPERDELQNMIWDLTIKGNLKNIVDYYDEWHPKKMSPYANNRRKEGGVLVVMDDIGKRTGQSRVREMLNHAGSNPMMPEALEPLQKMCTNPFRELTICYNGVVNICCMDWKHEYVCGHGGDFAVSLSEIWYGERFAAARAMLQSKDRNFGPCRLCTKNAGTRVGLCPKIPSPTEAQKMLVETITDEGAQNAPIDSKKVNKLKKTKKSKKSTRSA